MAATGNDDDQAYAPLTLGHILARLEVWADANGGLEAATIEVPVKAKAIDVEAANLVDVLSDYIHGRYLDYYRGEPTDEDRALGRVDAEGHLVVSL